MRFLEYLMSPVSEADRRRRAWPHAGVLALCRVPALFLLHLFPSVFLKSGRPSPALPPSLSCSCWSSHLAPWSWLSLMLQAVICSDLVAIAWSERCYLINFQAWEFFFPELREYKCSSSWALRGLWFVQTGLEAFSVHGHSGLQSTLDQEHYRKGKHRYW